VTAIVTWNIQNGRGCDGVADLARIARVAKAMGESDVLCFQEIARRDPAFGDGSDQVAALEGLFPGFQAIFGPTLVRGERQYGNMILSRLPVLQVFNHLLPHPAEGGIKHMQRQAVEAVVQTRGGPLRVVTTHLEYYSAAHRAAQVARPTIPCRGRRRSCCAGTSTSSRTTPSTGSSFSRRCWTPGAPRAPASPIR
jgi:endonuclease/exonuclease/phosphatase family metal-dependent hydrolase